MRNVVSPAEQRVVLDNISWPTYLGLVTDSNDPHSRIAYNRGTLEIMSPSQRHEQAAVTISQLIETFMVELGIAARSVRSTTFKREDVKRGFEADASYYIANVVAILGKDEIDLMIDPPPDLVVEVDISRSSVGKLELYQGLRVPEVWRYDGEVLRAYALQEDGSYCEVHQSPALPRLPLRAFMQFLDRRVSEDDTTLVRSFRSWVRERFGITDQ